MPALVDYPSSGSESESEDPPLSRTRLSDTALPPLPSSFLSLYSTNTRLSTSDDPSLHGSRRRQIPHVEGNWPTHVYLEWNPTATESATLHHLLQQLTLDPRRPTTTTTTTTKQLHSLLHSPLAAPQPLHISLSRPLQLRTDQRPVFLDRLSRAVRQVVRVEPFAAAFDAAPAGPGSGPGPSSSLSLSSSSSSRFLACEPNHDRSRWFVALRLRRPAGDGLNRLLAACNAVVEGMGLPGLYVGGEDGNHDDDDDDDGNGNDGLRNRNASTAREGGARRKGRQARETPMQVVDRSDSFHVSLAWSLEKPWDGRELDEKLTSISGAKDFDQIKEIRMPFHQLLVKIGNDIHSIELGTKFDDSQVGILG